MDRYADCLNTLNAPLLGKAIATAGGIRTTQARTVGIATPHPRIRTRGPFVCTPARRCVCRCLWTTAAVSAPADGSGESPPRLLRLQPATFAR